jgi:hypothetical protein
MFGLGVLAFGSFLGWLALFVLHVVACVWVYQDALRKGHSFGYILIAVLAVIFFPILGFLIYLLIRGSGGSSGR